MKHLLEIANIVTWKKVKKIEIFDEASLKNKSSKFNEFFEALMEGKFRNDRDASTLLYNSSPTDDKYRQLKSRFRKRLLNTLFFIDVNIPSASNYSRAYFSCNKDWTLVKILISYDARLTANDIAGQILTTSLKFKFADIIMNCARILRENASLEKNEKDFLYYNEIIKEYQEVVFAEMQSEELYQKVKLKFENTYTDEFQYNSELTQSCEELIILSEKYNSPVITFNMFLAWLIKFENEDDSMSVIEICNKMEDYITNFPQYEQDDKMVLFQLKKMSAYLKLKDFESSKKNTEKNGKYFIEGTNSWFQFMELYYLTALHSENFTNAFAIFTKISSSTKFKKASRILRDKWRIYEYYLFYLLENTNNSLNGIYQNRANQLFLKLLNDPVIYAKEFRTFTIQTVIAQILVAFENKNFLSCAENIERLKSYASKQSKFDESQRVSLFIKLLIQLLKSNFSLKFLSGHEKYFEKLENLSMQDKGNYFDIEIYPYEKLWKLLVSKLN